MERKGFTLIELLVVISIISLLSSVVLASLNSARDKGRLAAGKEFAAYNMHALGDQSRVILNFDEASGNATDLTGNGYTGTVSGATRSTETYSGTGRAVVFDGSNDYVDVPVIADLDGTEETVSLWVKHATPTSDNVMFNQAGWRRRLFNTQWVFVDLSGTYHYPSAAGINDGKWHHVAYTIKGTALKTFVDGKLTSSITMNALLPPPADIWRLGRLCGGASCDLYYSGAIDDFVIYGSALSIAQVENLYAKGASKHLAGI